MVLSSQVGKRALKRKGNRSRFALLLRYVQLSRVCPLLIIFFIVVMGKEVERIALHAPSMMPMILRIKSGHCFLFLIPAVERELNATFFVKFLYCWFKKTGRRRKSYC